MAEQSVYLADQGEYIATRDTYQTDGTNAREVQQVDIIHTRHGFQQASPYVQAGGCYRDVTVSDGYDLDPMPAGILNTAIDTGDSSIVVVGVQFEQNGATDGWILVTPIVMDDSNNFLFTLDPKTFTGIQPPGLSKVLFGAGNWSPCPMRRWSVSGCKKLGFHITLRYASGARLWATAITGVPDAFISDPMPAGGVTWHGYESGS